MLCLFFITFQLQAQDERDFRSLFSGQEKKATDTIERLRAKFQQASPLYQIDLTEDNRNESVVIEKRDGEDWIHLFDWRQKLVFSEKLDVKGVDSKIYRLRKRRISKSAVVLLLYYYEGFTKYLRTNANARFYLITIQDNDLSKITMTKGPAFWVEYRDKDRTYIRRRYQEYFSDVNQDGSKEFIVKYGKIVDILSYKGEGEWMRL